MDYLEQAKELINEKYLYSKAERHCWIGEIRELKEEIKKAGCGGKPEKGKGLIQTQEFPRCGHCSKYCRDCKEAIKILEGILNED